MASKGWTYDAKAKRFVSPSGRPLSEQASIQLRNRFAAARSEIARTLAERFSSGALTDAEFVAQFNQFIADTMTSAYMAGRGGANALLSSDESAILKLINDQLGFGDEFAKSLAGLSSDEIANRASLYGDAAVKAFEEGKAAKHGLQLEHYPGDWSTACKAGCRCVIEITEDANNYNLYWRTASDSSVCPDCEARAREWNPKVVPK